MTDASRKVLAALQDAWVVGYTAELVRRPSVNPPGDYAAVSAWVVQAFAEMGLEPRTLEGEPGRTNVIARIPGGGRAARPSAWPPTRT